MYTNKFIKKIYSEYSNKKMMKKKSLSHAQLYNIYEKIKYEIQCMSDSYGKSFIRNFLHTFEQLVGINSIALFI